MRYMTTVCVVTGDPQLFRRVAAALGDWYNIVCDESAGTPAPDLILRHWSVPSRSESATAAPVVVADLSLLTSDGLFSLVGRVLHGQLIRGPRLNGGAMYSPDVRSRRARGHLRVAERRQRPPGV
jgi:hypothetical protein